MKEKIEALRRLVEGKKCPEYYEMELGDGGSCNENCQICHGSKLDPAFAPLLEVVREKCPKCFHGGYRRQCRKCHGTGYVTRGWDGLPIGTLTGALGQGAYAAGLDIVWDYLWDDEAALDVVIEAVT